MQSQARVLQNGGILRIMTAGKVLHVAQPFADFDGSVVFTVSALTLQDLAFASLESPYASVIV